MIKIKEKLAAMGAKEKTRCLIIIILIIVIVLIY